MHCPPEDAAHLAAIARDFCPFPDYNPTPHFSNMLSVNSSLHLKDHYLAVQSSLTPTQLENFTQGLRITFGREGKVTYGGVGVVALSLAVLFDTLARKVKGECMSDQEPIPGLFLKDLSGSYLPQVSTISKYMRLIPHIANNPVRMQEETERYLQQLKTETQEVGEKFKNQMKIDAITVLTLSRLHIFTSLVEIHLARLTNGTMKNIDSDDKLNNKEIVFNLNCDPEVASATFMAEIQKSDNHTQNAFKICNPVERDPAKSVLLNVAEMNYLDVLFRPISTMGVSSEDFYNQRGDFDLKAHALGKWA